MSAYVCILLRFAHFDGAHTRANLAGVVYQKLGEENYDEDLYANQRGYLIRL